VSNRRTPWIALIALVAFAGGLAVAVGRWGDVRRVAGGAAAPAGAPSGAPAPDADSAALRVRWVDDVKGLEFADLDPRRREVFLRFANARSCTCGCGYTLAGCRAYDPTCEVSLPLAQALLDSVRSGAVSSARGLRERPHGGG